MKNQLLFLFLVIFYLCGKLIDQQEKMTKKSDRFIVKNYFGVENSDDEFVVETVEEEKDDETESDWVLVK